MLTVRSGSDILENVTEIQSSMLIKKLEKKLKKVLTVRSSSDILENVTEI